MTQFLQWVDLLQDNFKHEMPVTEDTKEIYAEMWHRLKRHPKFMWCLKAAEGWV